MARNNSIEKAFSSAAALQDAASAAIITLVTGGSKMQAVFEGVKAAILTKAIGPLAQISGVSMGALSAIRKLSNEFGVMGAKAAGSIEMLEQQFRPLLKSIEAAKNRMAELRKFAAETPFGLKEVAAANKVLENFSKGALSTKQSMILVGDAAAVAGQDLESVAMWVGRLYDGLQSGRPIGEAVFRLQEMGIVTGQARNAMEQMQASGASFSQMWRVVEIELGRARGGMEYTSKTLQSLEQQLEDVKEAAASGFGQGFLEGEKAGIEAQIKAISLLQPALEKWGQTQGVLGEVVNRFKVNVVDAAKRVPGLSDAVTIAGYAVESFATIITAISGVGIAKFLVSMLKSSAAIKSTTTAVAGLSAAYTAAKTAITSLAAGNTVLAAQSAKTAAITAGVSALGGAMNGVKFIARSLFVGIGGWMVAAVAGVSLLVGAFINWRQNVIRAADAVKSYTNETSGMIKSLRDTTDAISTVSGLMEQYAKNTRLSADAYRDLVDAQISGNAEQASAARARLDSLAEERKRVNEVASTRSLRKGEPVVDEFVSRAVEGAKLADQEARTKAENTQGPGRADAIRSFYEAQIKDQQQAAADYQKALLQPDSNNVSLSRLASNRGEQQSVLEAEIIRQQAEMSKRRAELEKDIETDSLNGGYVSENIRAKLVKEEAASTERIAKLRERIASLGTPEEDAMNIAASSGSELAKIKARISLYNAYKASESGVSTAQNSLDEALKGTNGQANPAQVEQARQALEEARNNERSLKSSLDRQYGSQDPGSAAQADEARARILEENLKWRSDQGRKLEAEQRLDSQALKEDGENKFAELAAAEKIVALQDDQLQAELGALELAKQRVALEIRFNGLSQQAANASIAALDAQIARSIELANRRKEMMRAEAEANAMGSTAGAMRAGGDVAGAREMERAEQRKRAEIIREQTYREAIAAGMGEREAGSLANKARRASNRSFEARQDQEARQIGNATSQRQGGLDATKLEQQATQAQAVGMQDYAAALREAAERKREESTRTARIEEAMSQYGVSRERATAMIEEEIQSGRKSRAIEEKRRQLELKLMKERDASEAKARRLENSGNDVAAQRERDRQRQKDRERELVESGYSRSEAKDMSRQERRESVRARSSDQYQAAAEAFAKFMEELRDMLERRKKFLDDVNDKELRAQGRGGEADRIKDQQEFENKAKDLQKSLWLSDGDAVRAANRDAKASFDLEKRLKLEGLQAKLDEVKAQKSEAVRGAKMELSGSSISSSMSKIGGASAISGSDVFHTDLSALRELQKETNEILQQIYEASSEEYEVHSMRRQSSIRTTRSNSATLAERGLR